MKEDSEVSTYVTMLEAMCKWGKISDITELICDWLEATLIVEDEENTSSGKVCLKVLVSCEILEYKKKMNPQP